MIGKTVREALPDIAGQGYFELLDNVYSSGEPFVGKALQVKLRQEPGAAPEEHYVDLVYQPIMGGDGTVSGIFVQGHDITERILAEQALQDSEAPFPHPGRRHAADGVVDQADGYHDYYNARWYEFTGMPEGSTDGAAWNGMFHPDDQERAWEPGAIPSRPVSRTRSNTGSGTAAAVSLDPRPCLADPNEAGEIERWFGTCTDISEIKEVEADLQAANDEIQRFAYIVSHDLRAPLVNIMGFTSELEATRAVIERYHKAVLDHGPDIADWRRASPWRRTCRKPSPSSAAPRPRWIGSSAPSSSSPAKDAGS